MESLVAGNEFVTESEAGHNASLLQPENGGEGTTEEDPFNGSEGNDTFGVAG